MRVSFPILATLRSASYRCKVCTTQPSHTLTRGPGYGIGVVNKTYTSDNPSLQIIFTCGYMFILNICTDSLVSSKDQRQNELFQLSMITQISLNFKKYLLIFSNLKLYFCIWLPLLRKTSMPQKRNR
jgi:hypothetical protein